MVAVFSIEDYYDLGSLVAYELNLKSKSLNGLFEKLRKIEQYETYFVFKKRNEYIILSLEEFDELDIKPKHYVIVEGRVNRYLVTLKK